MLTGAIKKIITKIIPLFTQRQCELFLEKLDDFYKKATCFKELAKQMVEYVNKKSYDIDFAKYSINLLDYVE